MYTIVVSSTLTGVVIHVQDNVSDEDVAWEVEDWRREPFVEVQTVNQDDGFPY